jgi:hypothetical protein
MTRNTGETEMPSNLIQLVPKGKDFFMIVPFVQFVAVLDHSTVFHLEVPGYHQELGLNFNCWYHMDMAKEVLPPCLFIAALVGVILGGYISDPASKLSG